MNATTRALTSVAFATLATPAKRKLLQEAHEQAAIFHQSLADAFDAERDLEEYATYSDKSDWTDEIEYARKKYAASLGAAAVALQKMPAKWAAILQCELNAVGEAYASEAQQVGVI